MAGKRLLLAAAVAAAVPLVAPAQAVPTPVTGSVKTHQYYVLAGHPDDSVPHWAWVEQRPSTDYLVFVSVTRSEGTLSCVAPEDAQPPVVRETTLELDAAPPVDGTVVPDPVAQSEPNQFISLLYPVAGSPWVMHYGEERSTGPYRYEGPGSPVGEPDRGERHPYGFPWAGQGSEACARAQVASGHWFLDEAHLIDGTGTTMLIDDPWTDDDFQGRHCFKTAAMVRAQAPPRRQREICAEVWANEESARIFFDLPDPHSGYTEKGEQMYTPLTFDDEAVGEALAFVRERRGGWNIPVLPEAGILAVGGYGDGNPCDAGASPAHKPLLDLVRWQDLDIGEQAGVLSCPRDPYGQGADVEHVSDLMMNPATLVAWNVVDPATGTRIGPLVKNFGWLLPNYIFDGCAPCSFWRRTS